MGEIEKNIDKLSNLLKKKYLNDNTNEQLEYLMKEIENIIKPKEEKITYQDLINVRDNFYEIKENEKLYSLALKKYETRMMAFERLFFEELNIIKICELINDEKIWDNQLTIEIKCNLNIDELIYLNYLYNIAINSMLENKEVKITLVKKEKNKQKKLSK
jgi:hypothetical protein